MSLYENLFIGGSDPIQAAAYNGHTEILQTFITNKVVPLTSMDKEGKSGKNYKKLTITE